MASPPCTVAAHERASARQFRPLRTVMRAAIRRDFAYTTGMAFIMIVDDAVDSCEPLAKYLEKSGHEVKCVPNGREALASVIARTPDVVVLDLLMPEMDGPSFLEVTRSYLRLQSLPVVVLTAMADGPLVERARNTKVNAILVKNKATFEDIAQAIAEALHRLPT
jgi:CheY-like chemotaxis protein